MEKKLKMKCVMSVTITIVGFLILLFINKLDYFSSLQQDYICGFSFGLLIAGIVSFIKYSLPLRSKEALRKKEIEYTDERLEHIMTKSMAITFRITVIIEALASVTLALADNEIGVFLGIIVYIQLIIYCILSAIISRKI